MKGDTPVFPIFRVDIVMSSCDGYLQLWQQSCDQQGINPKTKPISQEWQRGKSQSLFLVILVDC